MSQADADLGQIASRNAIAMLCLGLMLAAATLLLHISPPPALLLMGCILMTWKGWRPPVSRKVLRVLVFVGGLGLIFLTHGSLLGVQAGLSVLAVLISLKILEAHSPRDFHVLVLLGVFLCLTLLFFYQQLYVMLFVVAVTLLLFSSLVLAGTGSQMERARALRVITVLLLQALPLTVLLFVLFPRNLVNVHFSLRNSQQGQMGMSDQMIPGAIASLAGSEDPAFRVEFPEGNAPPAHELYWRGNVLLRGFGLSWMGAHHYLSREYRPASSGREIRQRITLEPHGNEWMFALDRPVKLPQGAAFMVGEYLRSRRPVTRTLRYEVASRPVNEEKTLYAGIRRQTLHVPKEVLTPRIETLGQSFRRENAEDTIAALLAHFQTNAFRYTMEPGQYGADGLDEFLFERRLGFCEHYAGAFATLARLAGIPSRVVIGYQGGEFNRHGDYLIVRQSHAHAWCEVFLEGNGWQRVDPTSVVAPGRIRSGSAAFNRAGRTEALEDSNGSMAINQPRWRRALHDFRLAWDNLQYQWDANVIDFGPETQTALFELGGLARPTRAALLIACAIGAATLIMSVGAFLYLRRRARQHPLVRTYEDFCQKIAAAGLSRHPSEGPRDFAERIIVRWPSAQAQIRQIADRYIQLRYGTDAEEDAVRKLQRDVKSFTLLKES